MSTVGLFDTIDLEKASGGVVLSCDDASIPRDARNLVSRAAPLMLQAGGIVTPGQSEAPPRIRDGVRFTPA